MATKSFGGRKVNTLEYEDMHPEWAVKLAKLNLDIARGLKYSSMTEYKRLIEDRSQELDRQLDRIHDPDGAA